MLCNKNNLNDELYEELLNNSIIDQNILNNLNTKNMSTISNELEKLKTKIFSYIFRENSTNKFTVPFKNMLMSCRHGSEICKASDFLSFFHSTFGYCQVLYSMHNSRNKSKSRKLIDRQGLYNSLQLELYLGEPNKLDFLSSSVGFSLFLFNHSESLNNYEPIDLAPGFHYNIAIDRTFVQQMPKPYSNCEVFQSTLGSYDSGLIREFEKQTYKQTNCFDLCYQKKAFEVCNCTDFIFDLRNPSKFCFEPNELKCIVDFYFLTYTKTDFIKKNCVPLCPLECERINVSPIVSSSKYPSDQYLEILRNNKLLTKNVFEKSNFTHVKNSILKLNIYYQQLSYTLIKESATSTIIDLLANIGGIFKPRN
jgi:hypothetical protein